jgi:nitroreductase
MTIREPVTVGILGFAAGGFLMYQYLSRKQLSETKAAIVQDVITKRRTVQASYYDPDYLVPRQHIEQMLEAANWAPTHGKTEPWRFVVFESREARLELGETDAAIYKSITPPNAFKQKKHDKKINSKLAASYVICICMKRQDSKKIPLQEEYMAVACAVQNMHLVGSALGLGCCWLSGATVESEEMRKYLELSGPEDMCLGFFCVGIPDRNKTIPSGHRKPIQDKVTWK